jgi:hypothetical protein
MAAPTRLQLYNNALLDVGERQLASLDEAREPRRLLDMAWDAGAVDWCLEQGRWDFATRSAQLDYSPSVEPPFGYARAFDKPVDWLSTLLVAEDPQFRVKLHQYVDEAGFWFADLDTIFVRYISNADDYGMDFGKWPSTFQRLVTAYLASEIATKLTQDKEKRDELQKALQAALVNARSLHERDENATALQWVLEQGQWNFAIRSVKIDFDPTFVHVFGMQRQYVKPPDWVRTAALCSDEYFKTPLLNYVDEGGKWQGDLDTIYVKYVSNDPEYGNNINRWPQSFQMAVTARRMYDIAVDTGDEHRIARAKKMMDLALTDALSKDAQNGPTRFAPPGTWTLSRRGRRTRFDRGNSGSLIG